MTVPLPPDELRAKIIETLAHTANGCLAELGLTPDLPQRLHELTEQNRLLYNDNVRLHVMLRHALDKIENIRVASPDAQTRRMIELERRLSVVQSERDQLLKALESKSDVAKEAAYQSLRAENVRLHARIEAHMLRHPKATNSAPKPQADMDTSADSQVKQPPTENAPIDQPIIDLPTNGQPSVESDTVSRPTNSTPAQMEAGEEDEEDDEEEFGLDGLRLISSCLEQLFDDTEQGRVCKLCRFVF